MPSVWIKENTFWKYADACGGPDEAKDRIQSLVEDHAPGGGDVD